VSELWSLLTLGSANLVMTHYTSQLIRRSVSCCPAAGWRVPNACVGFSLATVTIPKRVRLR
jgi:hypothetical protein